MQQSMNVVGRGRQWAVPLSRLAWVVVVIIVAVAVFLATRVLAQSTRGDAGTMPASAAIEERWGIRVSQVGVTADGGLVEVRFVVLDGDKALVAMQEENVPVMRADGSGAILWSAALMTNKHEVEPGRSGFLLYRNTNGAIQPGTSLTMAFGDLLLEHVVAR